MVHPTKYGPHHDDAFLHDMERLTLRIIDLKPVLPLCLSTDCPSFLSAVIIYSEWGQVAGSILLKSYIIK